MNFNATLIGQSITFIVFVWFCMKYIWPPLMAALDERNARISEGLAAAQQGQQDLENAQSKVADSLNDRTFVNPRNQDKETHLYRLNVLGYRSNCHPR